MQCIHYHSKGKKRLVTIFFGNQQILHFQHGRDNFMLDAQLNFHCSQLPPAIIAQKLSITFLDVDFFPILLV